MAKKLKQEKNAVKRHLSESACTNVMFMLARNLLPLVSQIDVKNDIQIPFKRHKFWTYHSTEKLLKAFKC